ncbi:MAG TPA: GNAT family N-acetyltransferase, partial [Roseiflexaceae bacterium]|nr:GNAT family N-acetyltransferase [Roseiflexaceae bacterium]
PADQSALTETVRFPMLLSPDRPLCVRPVTPADTTLLAELIAGLSDTARRRRFFRPVPSSELIWQEASRVTQREPRQGVALVATASERGRVCAVALAELVHDPVAPTAAELAVLVRDDMQRQGVGTRLLRLLIGLAGGRGVRTLHATLQAENRPARQLLRKLGLAYHTEIRYGEITAWAELP